MLVALQFKICLCFHTQLKIKIYETVVLTVVYRHETWFPSLMEERRLWVSRIRVLRKMFGLKREEATGDWSKLSYNELHNLCSSVYIDTIVESKG
jgi:hypothetical protein